MEAVAVGLNIEGGFPWVDLQKGGSGGRRWSNLVVVLDRPLVDNVVFDDLKAQVKRNRWPMLENGVPGIDESRMLVAYVSILGYYMAPEQKAEKITVHVHQAPEDAAHIVSFLKEAATHISLSLHKVGSPDVSFRTDNPFYCRQETKSDVLLSFSQCAGLDASVPAGALLVPSTFIPFDIETNTVYLGRKYSAENSLLKDLPHIIASPAHAFAVEYVKRNHVSANPDKRHPAKPLDLNEFVTNGTHGATLLQASAIWNPAPNTPIRIAK